MPVSSNFDGSPPGYVQAFEDDEGPFSFPVPDAGGQLSSDLTLPDFRPTGRDIIGSALMPFGSVYLSYLAWSMDVPALLLVALAVWLYGARSMLARWLVWANEFPGSLPGRFLRSARGRRLLIAARLSLPVGVRE